MKRLFAAFILLAWVVGPASSADIGKPAGEIILTITGADIAANTPRGAEFDAAMLLAMPLKVIETATPWHEGIIRFEGPLISDLMRRIGARARAAEFFALDEYSYEIPFSDFTADGPILAIRRNGEFMPEEDQGPLFVIYDYDSDPALNTEEIHSRSVWSVRRVELR